MMMKKLSAVVLIAILTVLVAGAKKKDTKGTPVMTFKETTYNFKKVDKGAKNVVHEFEFTNTGNGNLIINDVTTSCGCARPEFPKNIIAPGKTGKIKVTFLPVAEGPFRKDITVKSNSKPSKKRLSIEGWVSPEKK